MNTELFTDMPESKPTRLQAARIAFEKAFAECEECEMVFDEQGPEAQPALEASLVKLAETRRELSKAELEAL